MKMMSLATDRKVRNKILQEFDKSEKDLGEYVELIRNWAKTQPHLPEIPSDTMIEFFLIYNKFSLEITKQKVDMYYTIRTMIPDVYATINPKNTKMKNSFDHIYIIPLPKLVDDMYRIEIVKLKDIPYEEMDTNALLGKAFNVNEIRMQEKDLMFGDITIYDFEHLKMAHIVRFTPMHIRTLATVFEKVFSNRIKGVHIINHPPIFDTVMKLVKTVTKPKLYERIHLHNSFNSLSKYVPLRVLPRDYGGTELSLDELHEQWRLKFDEYQDHFDKLDTLKVNESLRPIPLNHGDSYGINGSFKRINID